jgi:catechol 2,3-dioxygenase-like lactoylglutathione lyase family enzyme
MLHHVTLEVSDIERAGAFYDALLRPLGWRRQIDGDQDKAWGIVKPIFFITKSSLPNAGGGLTTFGANGIAAVKAAWEGGLQAGGKGEDQPAQRPEQGVSYYSALINDPDGNRLEVCVAPD